MKGRLNIHMHHAFFAGRLEKLGAMASAKKLLDGDSSVTARFVVSHRVRLSEVKKSAGLSRVEGIDGIHSSEAEIAASVIGATPMLVLHES